jgi:putative flippase GtrA
VIGWVRFVRRRQGRYALISVVSALIAEAGLAIGYGIAHWELPLAILFSFALSTPPSYLMNRMFVWCRNERPIRSTVRELLGFVSVNVTGTAAAMVLISGSEHLARHLTTQQVVLNAVVDGTGAAAMLLVWGCRYLLLDRLVFRSRAVQTEA